MTIVGYGNGAEDFEWSYTEEPHATRRRVILAKYPEVKQCFGPDPSFKYVVVAQVVFQILMAWFVRDADWSLVMLQAYLVGGTISHSLTLAVHECSHNTGFGHASALPNRLLGFLANLPMCVPMSISFKKYHLEHHRNLGEDVLDTDVPTEFEARTFRGRLGKLTWLFLQPLFYAFRPLAIYKKAVMDMEILNFIIEIAFVAAVYQWMGGKSLFYLLGGFLLGLGVHPLAAHFVSDHYVFKPGQETYSYYGIINLVTYNVGYHVEHHDFPYVSGRNLPKIRAIASEYYTSQVVHDSWVRLMYDFVMDVSVSLHSRVKRRVADPGEYHFYGVGAYSSTRIHEWIGGVLSSLQRLWCVNTPLSISPSESLVRRSTTSENVRSDEDDDELLCEKFHSE